MNRNNLLEPKKNQKGINIKEIADALFFWLNKQVVRLKEKIMGMSLSSIAQWCIILVMLYLTLAG